MLSKVDLLHDRSHCCPGKVDTTSRSVLSGFNRKSNITQLSLRVVPARVMRKNRRLHLSIQARTTILQLDKKTGSSLLFTAASKLGTLLDGLRSTYRIRFSGSKKRDNLIKPLVENVR